MKRIILTIGEHPHTFEVVREAKAIIADDGLITMFGCDICSLFELTPRPCGTFTDVVRFRVEPKEELHAC